MPHFSSFTARIPPPFSRAIIVTDSIINALVMTFPDEEEKQKQKKGTEDDGDNGSDDDEVYIVSYRARLQAPRNR